MKPGGPPYETSKKTADSHKVQETCAVRDFFEKERSKPVGLRSKAAFISCKCKSCQRAHFGG